MPNVHEICTALFDAAPAYMKMDWDNVGLMCGHPERAVTRVMVALDASMDTLTEARAAGCELVVCHHPMIFGGTKTVTTQTPTGARLCMRSKTEWPSSVCTPIWTVRRRA